MEKEIGGKLYRTGRLDALKQLHVSRKLAPAIFALGASASSLKAPVEGTEEVAILDIAVGAFEPLAKAISGMEEKDVDYVVHTCLDVCERQDSPGGPWAKMRASNGALMFQDIGLKELMQVVILVIRENLGDFFPDPSAAGNKT